MLRPFRSSDLEALLDVWYRASLEAHSFLPAQHFVDERRLIAEQFLPASETTVYEVDGRVVGFLSLVDNEVGGFFVDPEKQGSGIGRALMNHAASSRSYLELGVFEANAIGRRFYDRYGFVVVDRGIEEGTGEPELRMRFDSP